MADQAWGSAPFEAPMTTAAAAGKDIALARAAIARLGFFCSERPGETSIARLGGLTNAVFKIGCNGDNYVLRVPGEGTEDYIDRGFEAVAAREAARVGVAPEVIVAEPETGLMVSVYRKAVTMTPQRFKTVPGAPSRAAAVLRRLHTSDAKFQFQFDLSSMIEENLRQLRSFRQARVPEGFQRVLRDAESLQRLLAGRPVPKVACQCDPLPDNFLDTGRRMWLVDWEFSGMNDPLWDLADLSVEAGFDARQDDELIAAYFGGEPTPFERGRIAAYKALSDLLWTVWGLVQLANANPADDFWQYANRRFDRCKRLMGSAGFAAQVAAIANG